MLVVYHNIPANRLFEEDELKGEGIMQMLSEIAWELFFFFFFVGIDKRKIHVRFI